MLLGWLFVHWHVYHEIGSSGPMCGSNSQVMVEDLSTHRGFFVESIKQQCRGLCGGNKWTCGGHLLPHWTGDNV